MWLFIASAIFVMASHFVADFVCQTRWMGLNKSKEWLPLLAHGAAYTAGMFGVLLLAFFLLSFIFPSLSITWVSILIYTVCNGIIHTAIDYFSSRMSSKAFKNDNMDRFWLIIGGDQLVHEIILLISLGILLAVCVI